MPIKILPLHRKMIRETLVAREARKMMTQAIRVRAEETYLILPTRTRRQVPILTAAVLHRTAVALLRPRQAKKHHIRQKTIPVMQAASAAKKGTIREMKVRNRSSQHLSLYQQAHQRYQPYQRQQVLRHPLLRVTSARRARHVAVAA